jgi:hypothetical protein
LTYAWCYVILAYKIYKSIDFTRGINMAADVQITLSLVDGGSIKLTTKDVQTLKEQLLATEQQATRTSKAVSQAGARPAGAAMASAGIPQYAASSGMDRGTTGAGGGDASKDFARQAQGLGGLVHVYATFAANLFAVGAAWTALSIAADTANLIKGMDQLSVSSGKSLTNVARQLRDVTEGAISMKAAMTATAQANAGQLSGDQFLRLAQVAKNASTALGRDLPESLSRLTLGVVKSQPELLDELGIIVRVTQAQNAYARQLGVSVTSLTAYQKSQAFANEAIKQGEIKFGAINVEVNPYSKLMASMTDLATSGLNLINTVLGPVAKYLAESPTTLALVMAGIATMLVSKAIPALSEWRVGLVKSAEAAAVTAKKLAETHELFKANAAAQAGDAIMEPLNAKINAGIANIRTNLAKALPENSRLLSKIMSEAYTPSTSDDKSFERQQKLNESQLKQANILMDNNALSESQKIIVQQTIAAREKDIDLIKIARMELQATIVEQEKLSIEAAKTAEAIGRPGNFASLEAAHNRNAKSAAQKAESAAVLANVGQNTQEMGPGAALKKLWSDTLNGTNASFDENGKVVEKSTNRLIVWRAIATLTSGTARILAVSITTIAMSLMNVFAVIGMVVMVFDMLNSAFNSNAKQVEKFKSEVESMSTAVDTASSTIDNLNKKNTKDFLNEESMKARSNAVAGLADSLIKTAEAYNEADRNSGIWSRGLDSIKLYGDLSSTLIENLPKNIEQSLNLATDEVSKSKFRGTLSDILQLKPEETLNLKTAEEALNRLTKPERIAAVEKIAAAEKALSNNINNATSNTTTFTTSLDNAGKSFKAMTTSLLPSDTAGKFASDQIDSANALAKALHNPIQGVEALSKATEDLNMIQMMSPSVRKQFEEQSSVINSLQEAYSKATSEASNYEKKAQDLKQKSGSMASTATKYEIVTLQKQAQEARDTANKLAPELEKMTKGIGALVSGDMFDQGVKNLTKKLIEAGEAAGIAIAKNAFKGGVTTPEAVAAMTKLEVEGINTQIRLIDATLSLSKNMEEAAISKTITDAGINSSKQEAIIKDGASSPAAVAAARVAIASNNSTIEISQRSQKILEEVTKAFNSPTELQKISDKYKGDVVLTPALSLLKQGIGASQQKVGLGAQKTNIIEDGAIGILTATNTQLQKVSTFEKSILDNRLASNTTLRSSLGSYNTVLEVEAVSLVNSREELLIKDKQRDLQNQIDKSTKIISDHTKKGIIEEGVLAQQNADITDKHNALLLQLNSSTEAVHASEAEYNKNKFAESTRIVALDNAHLQALEEQRQSKISIGLTELETANSLYTLNQQLYAQSKLKLETERINSKEVLDLNKVASDKAIALGKIEMAIADAKIEAQLEFNRVSNNPKATRSEKASASSTLESKISSIGVGRSAQIAEVSKAYEDQTSKIIANSEAQRASVKSTADIAVAQANVNDKLKEQQGIITSLTSLFSTLGTTISTVSSDWANNTAKQAKLDAGYEDQKNKYATETAERAALDKNYAKQTDELTMGNLSSTKKLFSEKSSAYQAISKIEMAVHLVTMGIYLKENAAKMFSTGVTLVQNGLKTASNIITGAAAFFAESGWAGFIGVAAMMALLATLGHSGGGGGGAPAIPENLGAAQGGGVLGDKTKSSDSITQGIDLLAKNSNPLLDYNKKMLASMQSIAGDMSGLSTAIYKIAGINDPSALDSPWAGIESKTVSGLTKAFGTIAPILGNIIGSIFGGSTTTSITQTGIQIKGFIDAVGTFNGAVISYANITQKTSGGWFASDSYSSWVQTSTAGMEEASAKVGKIITGISNTIKEGLKQMEGSISQQTIDQAMAKIQAVPIDLAIALNGLTPDEQLKKLNTTFSNVFDSFARTAMPNIDLFIQAGESAGQTFARIAKQIQNVGMSLKLIGTIYTDPVHRAAKTNSEIISSNKAYQQVVVHNIIETIKGIWSPQYIKDMQTPAPMPAQMQIIYTKLTSAVDLFNKQPKATDYTRAIFALSTAKANQTSDTAKYNTPGGGGLPVMQLYTDAQVVAAAQSTIDSLEKATPALKSLQAQVDIMTNAFNGDSLAYYTQEMALLTDKLYAATGGVDAYNTQMDFVTSKFISADESVKILADSLSTEFKDTTAATADTIGGLGAQLALANHTIPTTREEFKTLMQTVASELDSTNSNSINLYASLLKIAPAFDAVHQIVGAAALSLNALQKSFLDLQVQMFTAQGNLWGAVDLQRKLDLANTDVATSAGAAALAQYNLNATYKSLMQSTKDSITLNNKLNVLKGNTTDAEIQRNNDIAAQQALLAAIVDTSANSTGAATAAIINNNIALINETYELQKSTASLKAKNDLEVKIYTALGKTEQALLLTRQATLDVMDASLRPMQVYLNALEDEATVKTKLKTAYDKESATLSTTITSLKAAVITLSDLRKSLQQGTLSTLTAKQKYDNSKVDFLNIKTAAQQILNPLTATAEETQAKNDAIGKISQAANDLLTNSQVLYASSDAYTVDYQSVLDALGNTGTVLGEQATIADLQLSAMTESVTALGLIQDNTDTTASLLQQLLDMALVTEAARQASVDAGSMSSMNSSNKKTIMPISDSLVPSKLTSTSSLTQQQVSAANDANTTAQVTAATLTAQATQAAASASILNTNAGDIQWQAGILDQFANNNDMQAAYKYLLPRGGHLADMENAWLGVGIRYDNYQNADGEGYQSFADFASDTQYVPYFAQGGRHTGGARIVGEKGPELEVTGPSNIFSHDQTRAMFKQDNSELIAEIRSLREEVASLRQEQQVQTGHLIQTVFTSSNDSAARIVNATQEVAVDTQWANRSALKVA